MLLWVWLWAQLWAWRSHEAGQIVSDCARAGSPPGSSGRLLLGLRVLLSLHVRVAYFFLSCAKTKGRRKKKGAKKKGRQKKGAEKRSHPYLRQAPMGLPRYTRIPPSTLMHICILLGSHAFDESRQTVCIPAPCPFDQRSCACNVTCGGLD